MFVSESCWWEAHTYLYRTPPTRTRDPRDALALFCGGVYAPSEYRRIPAMASQFLTSLRAEISALEADLHRDPRYLKLRSLQDVLRLYEGGAVSEVEPEKVDSGRGTPQEPSRGPKESQGRQPSEARVKAVALSADLIRGRTSPTPTRELYSMLVERGVEIGGKEPVSNLSAILSKTEGFKSIGRSGWLLEVDRSDEQPSTEVSAVVAAEDEPDRSSTPPNDDDEDDALV